MTAKIVHVVHAIDTEGPLFEPLEVTFQRIADVFGVHLEPTVENLRLLQRQEMKIGGNEDKIARMVGPQLLAYNDTWEKIEDMLREIMSPSFRNAVPDSFGGGWVYNWYCVDHVGYDSNPRRRDIGYHNVFDRYAAFKQQFASPQDGLHFHFHPLPISRAANHNATTWIGQDTRLFDILARRIIDRHWFPHSNRPGFHVTRPDSHWFLEQHIPFDFASQATAEQPDQPDQSGGRLGDWRRAPLSWQPYHPHHDDYQVPGQCRRWVFRCLNLGTRLRLLRQSDVDQAFAEAADSKPVVLAFANHDFRDMRPDVATCQKMLLEAAHRHPGVKFKYCEARQAARAALRLQETRALELAMTVEDNILHVASNHPIFGPQPFFAMRSVDGQYFYQNLDFQEPFQRWSFVLDEQTLLSDKVDRLGVAACDAAGHVAVTVRNHRSGQSEARSW